MSARPAAPAPDTKQKILDVARELFAANGVEATTMRAIAHRIGTSAAAIYHHFPDKESLVKEIMTSGLRSLGASLARARRIPDPIERLMEIGMAYVRFGLEHPQHYRVLFMTPTVKSPELEAEITRDLEATPEEDAYLILLDIVNEAIRTGRFGPDYQDAERVAQICWSTVHGIVSLDIVFSCQRWLEWRDPIRTAERLLGALLVGLQAGAPGR
ncbi:MAG: TetR/AcrR family transcriptional regulator [Gemmatimonadales bacterium]